MKKLPKPHKLFKNELSDANALGSLAKLKDLSQLRSLDDEDLPRIVSFSELKFGASLSDDCSGCLESDED